MNNNDDDNDDDDDDDHSAGTAEEDTSLLAKLLCCPCRVRQATLEKNRPPGIRRLDPAELRCLGPQRVHG